MPIKFDVQIYELSKRERHLTLTIERHDTI